MLQLVPGILSFLIFKLWFHAKGREGGAAGGVCVCVGAYNFCALVTPTLSHRKKKNEREKEKKEKKKEKKKSHKKGRRRMLK